MLLLGGVLQMVVNWPLKALYAPKVIVGILRTHKAVASVNGDLSTEEVGQRFTALVYKQVARRMLDQLDF